ncbi:MAG: 3-deoxy-D-manno-octulosonic acid transferase [Deltaproteobacteria bacterium]|nr:3-deoxy-D-manno-octulosonic acid transferase [Deltaproteobacteria bacterium]
MYLIYDIFIHLSFILFLPYFLFKIIFVGKYRKGMLERFGFIANEKVISNKNRIWFHAVSVGETKAVMPLLKMFKQRHPDICIIFSTTTYTGNKVARDYGIGCMDSIIYFPLDFSWVVKRVVDKINPKALIVVEKEIWPNILNVLNSKGIPIIVVNGKISDRSFKRYVFSGFFFKRIFQNITAFCGQTNKDCERAVKVGIDPKRIFVTGNIKFDMETQSLNYDEKEKIMQTMGITNSDIVFAAGSTHKGEEDIILDVFGRLKNEIKNLKLIIAPRHPERFKEVENLIKNKGFSFLKRTESLNPQLSPAYNLQGQATLNSYDVIFLDTIGELGKIYSLANAAFVGGSLVNVGGHNLLEPALHKKPVIFGPHIQTFSEGADMLTKGGGGIMVKDSNELEERLRQIFLHDSLAQKIGEAGYKVIELNRGAAEKSLEIIERVMS